MSSIEGNRPFSDLLPVSELARRTKTWIDVNPEVCMLFVRLALGKHARGQRFGMKQLAEAVRWEFPEVGERTSPFKLNNLYVAYIGRWLIENYPVLRTSISFRKVIADDCEYPQPPPLPTESDHDG